MNPPQPFIPAKPRVQRKRHAVAPASPVTPNQIQSVVLGPAAEQLTVTVSSAVVAITDPALGMWLYSPDIDPQLATAAEVSGTVVVFTFAVDVSGSNGWNIEDPSVWQMADEQPLVEPFGGPLP